MKRLLLSLVLALALTILLVYVPSALGRTPVAAPAGAVKAADAYLLAMKQHNASGVCHLISIVVYQANSSVDKGGKPLYAECTKALSQPGTFADIKSFSRVGAGHVSGKVSSVDYLVVLKDGTKVKVALILNLDPNGWKIATIVSA